MIIVPVIAIVRIVAEAPYLFDREPFGQKKDLDKLR